MKRCIGLDTETARGRAILIATPDRHAIVASWRDCIGFLFAGATDDYCLWNMNYDARAICAWLPRTVLRSLSLTGRGAWRDTSIVWRGRKSFALTRAGRTVHLWDCQPYYEAALDTAAREYLGEGKAGIPRSWLSCMDVHMSIPAHARRIIRYCRRDAALTQRLWDILENQCQALGVSCFRAASPASVARRAFADVFQALVKCADSNRIFRRSYYGGRTEIYRRGHLRGVHAYDIHSAYPAVAACLRDPTGCRLVRWDGRRRLAESDVAYGAYHIVIHVRPEDPIPPLPYRAPGRLIYPAGLFETDVDAVTFRYLRARRYEMRVLWAWEFLIEDDRPLFPTLHRWYRARQENPAVKLAAKKVLNSLYGKCAERIHIRGESRSQYIRPGMVYSDGAWYESREMPARHTCFAVAAAITAGCRIQVLRAMAHNPRAIVACHTDGILSTAPLPLQCGPEMGAWGDEGKWSHAWIIGTGIGLYSAGREWKQKSRGVHGDISGLLESDRPVYSVPVRHARTLHESRLAGYSGLNEMLEIDRDVDINMDSKRIWPCPWISGREMACNSQRSRPIIVVERRALRRWKEGSSDGKAQGRRRGRAGRRCAGKGRG